MGLDKANIFKLDNKELENYKTDPFLDCFESTKDFAKSLKNDIDTKETPHSLLLSADYGMGKTFFSTRFAQYLRNNRYDVIYFSAWENDYLQEPFIAFSKAIVSYIHNKFNAERYKANVAKLFDITQNIVSSVTFSCRFGISLSAEQLIDTFKTKIDPIIEFRKQLTSFINKISKKKLILIVDELDRCRPDYAMKTLECIKHFFDIEGLFIIVPTNKTALNDCIKSLYGIDNQNRYSNKENYFQKFFNDERILKRPIDRDYLYIVGQYLTSTRLEEALSKKLLSEDKNCYNSIILLRNWFATFSYNAGLSVRELKDFSIELARICNNFYEPIRVEWLACVFANRNIPKDTHYIYPIPNEHCFYCEAYKDIEHSSNGKQSILNLSEYSSSVRRLKPVEFFHFHNNPQLSNQYHSFLNKYKTIPNSKKYSDIEAWFEAILADIKIIEDSEIMPGLVKENMKILKDGIARQKTIIEQYQSRYGSDDDDAVRRQTYINIVQNPETLYFTTCL